MYEITLNILLALAALPFALLLYTSGLLLWPLRRWRRRGQKVQGNALGYVSISQLLAYVAVGCAMLFVHLDHFYYWFAFLIELNIVFTVAGLFAWSRDNRFEKRLTRSTR
jgi:hypothetical protein